MLLLEVVFVNHCTINTWKFSVLQQMRFFFLWLSFFILMYHVDVSVYGRVFECFRFYFSMLPSIAVKGKLNTNVKYWCFKGQCIELHFNFATSFIETYNHTHFTLWNAEEIVGWCSTQKGTCCSWPYEFFSMWNAYLIDGKFCFSWSKFNWGCSICVLCLLSFLSYNY